MIANTADATNIWLFMRIAAQPEPLLTKPVRKITKSYIVSQIDESQKTTFKTTDPAFCFSLLIKFHETYEFC